MGMRGVRQVPVGGYSASGGPPWGAGQMLGRGLREQVFAEAACPRSGVSGLSSGPHLWGGVQSEWSEQGGGQASARATHPCSGWTRPLKSPRATGGVGTTRSEAWQDRGSCAGFSSDGAGQTPCRL